MTLSRLIRETPKQALVVIRQPYGIVSEAQGVAAVTDPLAQNFVGLAVNLGEWNIKDTGPHRISSIADVATRSRYARNNCNGQLPALLVDATNRAVSLVQRPN